MSSIAWLLVILLAIASGTVLQMLVSFFMLKLIVAPLCVAGFNHIFKSVDPSQVVDNPILTAFLTPVWFIISTIIVTPWALFTLDDGGWVTRQDGLTGNA
jgi:hypothetical protein